MMGLRALVVEDDDYVSDKFVGYLKEAGFDKVDLATTYRDAMRCSGKNYDLVVCDTLNEDNRPVFPKVIRDMRRRGIDTTVVANSSDINCAKYWEGIENIQFVEKDKINSQYIREITDTLN